MKKIVLLAVIGALVVGVGQMTRAAAADPRDGNGPNIIIGTPGDDLLLGGRGPDIIRGLSGDDVIWTGKGGPGDEAYGGRGDDVLNNWGSGNAPGLLDGGPGRDVCRGNESDTYVRCERVVVR